MTLTIYTDGGSIGNPGPSAFAYIVYKNKKLIYSYSEPIGVATNNVAEYSGLINGLTKIKELISNFKFQISNIVVYSDSSLMVNQLNGLFKVKNAAIREFVLKVRILEREIKTPIMYKQIPREKNQLADSLVKRALQ